MVRDQRRLAHDVAAFKGSAQTLGGPSLDCRSHDDTSGHTTLVLCDSGRSTIYFAADKRAWFTFGVTAVLTLTFASLPLLRARRRPTG